MGLFSRLRSHLWWRKRHGRPPSPTESEAASVAAWAAAQRALESETERRKLKKLPDGKLDVLYFPEREEYAELKQRMEANRLNSPLLRLPMEIRLIIYGYIFEIGLVPTIPISAAESSPHYGYEMKLAFKSLVLLQVCRQIYYEAAAFPFTASTFLYLDGIGGIPRFPEMTSQPYQRQAVNRIQVRAYTHNKEWPSPTMSLKPKTNFVDSFGTIIRKDLKRIREVVLEYPRAEDLGWWPELIPLWENRVQEIEMTMRRTWPKANIVRAKRWERTPPDDSEEKAAYLAAQEAYIYYD